MTTFDPWHLEVERKLRKGVRVRVAGLAGVGTVTDWRWEGSKLTVTVTFPYSYRLQRAPTMKEPAENIIFLP